MTNILSKSHAINKLNEELINSNLLAVRNLAEVKKYFLQLLKSFDLIRTVAFGSEFGDFIGVGKRSQGVFDFAVADKTKDHDYYVHLADKQGESTKLLKTVKKYYPQKRSWYKSAIEAKGPSWSPVYVWASQTNIGISAVLPVYYDDGSPKGVVMSALPLGFISNYLNNRERIYSEQVYIIDRSGMLVATSTTDPILHTEKGENGTKLRRIAAKESSNLIIQNPAKYLLNRFSDFNQVTLDFHETVVINGKNHIVNVSKYNPEPGLDWLVVIVTPEEAILESVKASARTTIVVSLLVLIFASLTGFIATRFITQPIIQLNEDIKTFTPGRWKMIENDSRFKEVNQLTLSYNLMISHLQEVFEALEGRVEERTKKLSRTNKNLEFQIAERKKIESKLHESKDLLDAAGRMARVGGWEVDAKTMEVSWTDETYRIHEIPFDHKVPFESAIEFFHPDDQKRLSQAIQRAIEHGEPYDMELRLVSAKGNHIWARTICRPELKNGKILKLKGMLQDITERKDAQIALLKSESRYRALFDLNPIQTVVVDNDGKITMFNFAKRKLSGSIPSVGDVMYIDYADKHEIDIHKELTECIRTGGKKAFPELRYKKRYLSIQISPFAEGAIITSEDVTERKRLQGLLEQVRKMEAVGTLSGGIAHEFNNILGIIIGNTELAMDDIPDYNPICDYLSEVKNASIRGKEIVSQLLSFSHKATHKKKPIDIASVVSESMKFLRASIPSSIAFDVKIDEQCNFVMGDKTQIHQLMINLCNNAAQSIEEKTGLLTIRLKNKTIIKKKFFAGQQLGPGSYVHLVISDNGKGISSNILEKIFDPFFTTKEVDQGSGMGLSIVYGIIKGHDGFIEVMSAPENGTDVFCYFPAIDVAPVIAKEKTEKFPKGSGDIIFVDDEPSIVKMSKLLLEKLGYRVEATTDPSMVVEIFKANPTKFDLVITDMTMPQMTGDLLIKELKKIRDDIKTIICTGYSKRMDENKALQIGATGYIMKPIDQKTLSKTVQKVLDKVKDSTHD